MVPRRAGGFALPRREVQLQRPHRRFRTHSTERHRGRRLPRGRPRCPVRPSDACPQQRALSSRVAVLQQGSVPQRRRPAVSRSRLSGDRRSHVDRGTAAEAVAAAESAHSVDVLQPIDSDVHVAEPVLSDIAIGNPTEAVQPSLSRLGRGFDRLGKIPLRPAPQAVPSGALTSSGRHRTCIRHTKQPLPSPPEGEPERGRPGC
ncbi:hypothetical protein PLANTIT3_60679 [Plantibacter sp. T3]|nr:hypothetical protein PLANTIT3_60679 [Plantibacter sp. T3]